MFRESKSLPSHAGEVPGRPVDRFDTDRAAMLRPPPVTPSLGWRASVRLPRNYYIRLDGNVYSVDPSVIGRRIEVTADLTTVTISCTGRAVAVHDRARPSIRRLPTCSTARPPSSCNTGRASHPHPLTVRSSNAS